MSKNKPANIIGSAPKFLVADVVKSAEYYRDSLGFTYSKMWGDPPGFCIPRRNNFMIMLSQVGNTQELAPNHKIEGPSRWDAYFFVDDAGKLFNEFKSKNAHIVYEPIIKKFTA